MWSCRFPLAGRFGSQEKTRGAGMLTIDARLVGFGSLEFRLRLGSDCEESLLPSGMQGNWVRIPSCTQGPSWIPRFNCAQRLPGSAARVGSSFLLSFPLFFVWECIDALLSPPVVSAFFTAFASQLRAPDSA